MLGAGLVVLMNALVLVVLHRAVLASHDAKRKQLSAQTTKAQSENRFAEC
jgi:hypothetical protein